MPGWIDLPPLPEVEGDDSARDNLLEQKGQLWQDQKEQGRESGQVLDKEPKKLNKWQQRILQEQQISGKPAISLAEIEAAEIQVTELQRTGVELVQRTLNSLAGRRGEPDQCKAIADRVRELAKGFGASLLYGDQPVYLVWSRGVFVLNSTNSARDYISSSSTFPKLTAHIKKTILRDSVTKSVPHDESPARSGRE